MLIILEPVKKVQREWDHEDRPEKAHETDDDPGEADPQELTNAPEKPQHALQCEPVRRDRALIILERDLDVYLYLVGLWWCSR